jgi:hypothetical protein
METPKTLSEIFEEIEHYKDYLKLRVDIISANPKRWLGNSFYELPSFQYYLKNCVNDKDGSYDFTKRRYGNQSCSHVFHISNSVLRVKQEVTLRLKHSIWMGTPFNYKTIIE